MTGQGKPTRNEWFYFTEDELTPGAVRVGNFKYVFNLRGDDGQATGGLSVDTNPGWKGSKSYVATVPQVFDLLQDPQERYDIFMTTFTESTWAVVPANDAVKKKMKTYVEYPPRKLQSETYTGPITSPSTSGSSGCANSWRRTASILGCRPETRTGQISPPSIMFPPRVRGKH
jgi:hypothetical protein